MNVLDWAFVEPSVVVGSIYCKTCAPGYVLNCTVPNDEFSIVSEKLSTATPSRFRLFKWAGPYKAFSPDQAVETNSSFFSNWSIADPPVTEAVGHRNNVNAVKATSADRVSAAGMDRLA
jgi:hypothetical protein